MAGSVNSPTDLDPPQDPVWSILNELAEIARNDESELRKILRPHEEAGLSWVLDAPTILRRDRLDVALVKLTLLEISYQVHRSTPIKASDPSRQDPPFVPIPARSSLETLIKSEAFLHYCDSYLYFGVRFLGERISSAESLAKDMVKLNIKSDSHWRPFSLAKPPDLSGDKRLADAFFVLQEAQRTNEEEAALRFLDGFLDKPLDYELWLRGLLNEFDPHQQVRFSIMTSGFESWIEKRVRFYQELASTSESEDAHRSGADGQLAPTLMFGAENAADLGHAFSSDVVFQRTTYGQEAAGDLFGRPRPVGGWTIDDPIAARFGLADIYWIARLLRASVSSSGSVTYSGTSWLHLFRFHAITLGELSRADRIRQYEEVIRSVFDYVCDLIQNAINVTSDDVRLTVNPEDVPTWPSETRGWQHVFNEELTEISLQRKLRQYRDSSGTVSPLPSGGRGAAGDVASSATSGSHPALEQWSQRLTSPDTPLNLVGVAFSGGGIRSATFNLGVLQGLQELDLLRNVDYLSTVSGGGYIGSWLLANVRRSAHWLGRVTDWSPSIAHLRAYSNYLAPRTGILSADTWTMAASWARNAFLIQLTGLTWLFFLLLFGLESKKVFDAISVWGVHEFSVSQFIALLAGVLVTITLLYNLYGTGVTTGLRSRASKWVRRLAVLPAWIGAFAVGSLFWHDASSATSRWLCLDLVTGFGGVLTHAWKPWLPLLVFTFIALTVVAFLTLQHRKEIAFGISAFCTGVLYLGLAGVFYVDLLLARADKDPNSWFAFVFSPALVLLAFSLSVVLFIGLTGRNSSEGIREWWTRFGAWLAIYALIGIALFGAAAFGPTLIALLWSFLHYPALKWGSILGWLGTVIGGLFAGKSGKTSGEADKSFGLQVLAVVGGVLFIVGAILLSSTLLYLLLFKMFGNDGAKLGDFVPIVHNLGSHRIPEALAAALILGVIFSYFFEINIFGFNQFYRNRIARCYLGASRFSPNARKPNPFTGFDFLDDLRLHHLQKDRDHDKANGHFRGPFPIINCALNLGGSADLSVKTRHSASFFLTPFRCGSDRPMVGFAPTLSGDRAFAGGIMLGQAVAVSGAAVSPNMGYNTSPLVAFLLTMFNVRLGWWFPNPGRSLWKRSGLNFSLYYLTRELLGLADERRMFLNVSDGGHFENLGVYELVRRRCKVIFACDAECDENLQFGGLGNLIRMCETDFGAIIDIDVRSIGEQKDSHSISHCAIGQIKYSNGSLGHLIYFKASITGDEPVSVTQYRSAHPSFPHESTSNQFFSEDQFESYRKLGRHVVEHSLRGTVPGQHPVAIAEKLADVLTPAGCPSEAFLKHSSALSAIWDKFRDMPDLYPFLRELMGGKLVVPAAVLAAPPQAPAAVQPAPAPATPGTPGAVDEPELCVGLQLIQLMENVFLDLRLDDFWEHPDNRGWAILFMQWSQSSTFRQIWGQSRRTFGIRFEHFCAARLGLVRDRPTVRV